MKPTPTTPADRIRSALAIGLATLLTVSASAQSADSDALRRLQEENAALRKRLAELETPAKPASPAAATAPATSSPAPAAAPATATTTREDGVLVLSPFEVSSDKDYGYLKTNSMTATRIGMPIQKTPMSVSVLSKDFLDDANIRSLTDILRYSSSGAGDNNYAMRRPANSATPQGGFTMRGFGVNTVLRNGVPRYIGYNVNNVDRVEVVKGPASVFFGAGYPGGVINYVTKQPVFGKSPTMISYTVGDESLERVVVDMNSNMGRKAAMRIVGSWEDSKGAAVFEKNKTNSVTGNLALVPFASGKVKLTFEMEHLESRFNQNQGSWIWPQGWFDAYANPSAALMTAAGSATADAYRARILSSPGNYIADARKAANDYGIPLWTSATRGAYYQDKNGNRVLDKGFNYTNRGTFSNNVVNTPSLTVEMSPFSWMDFRYVMVRENARFDSLEGTQTPTADGRTFNALTGNSTSGYYRKLNTHQFDAIFKKELWGMKHTLLVGGLFQEQLQQYNANAPLSPNYSQIPGATNPAGNPGVVITGSVGTGGQFAPWVSTADVPVNQVIRDRYGNIKTVQQVFTQWDPGYEIQPDISRVFLYDRTLLDGYYTQYQAGYVNYNGSLFNDRLNILAGVRREMNRDSGQYLTSNFPWFAPPPYAFADQAAYPPSVYNYTPSYSGSYDMFTRQAGTSWMGGASFEIVKDVNVFASFSKTFRLNVGNAGGIGEVALPDIYNAAMAYQRSVGSSSFVYNGQTITSIDQFRSAIASTGALVKVPNETGTNMEIGVKTSLWDNKLVGTLSVFRAERKDQRYDDSARQVAENLNYGNNLGIFGPAGTNAYANTRVLRWRTVGLKNRIEGADFEVIWTPTRHFQTVLNGAWMWTAKTVDNPTVPRPGTTAYNALTGVAKINADLQYGERIENVPEFRLNMLNKYTFRDGIVRGLSVGLGTRYSSETIISRTADYNPRRGGLTSGNFLVFDVTASYPWEVLGYKLQTNLGIYNATDKDYIEGPTTVLSPPRTWLLTNTLTF